MNEVVVLMDSLETTHRDLELRRAQLRTRVNFGFQQQKKMLEVVTSRVVRNKLPLPHTLKVAVDSQGEVFLTSNNPEEPKQEFFAKMHTNALGQMADNKPDIQLSMRDIRWFLAGDTHRQQLVPHIFNTLFDNEEFVTGQKKKRIKRFLVRLVKEGNSGTEDVRAFLSDKFGVTYDTKELLKAFVESCQKVGAGPVSAFYNDTQTSLTCCLPYVFEPVDGNFIALGVNFTNSDFGRGLFAISTVAFLLSSGTSSILEHEHSKRHIGSVLKCTELESSAEFKAAEVAAQAQAVRDLVPRALSVDAARNTLELIQFAHEKSIPWYKANNFLTTVAKLSKEERERVRAILAGPPMPELPSPSMDDNGDPQANAWWLANMIGWMGENELKEKKHELELAAGKLLGRVGEEG